MQQMYGSKALLPHHLCRCQSKYIIKRLALPLKPLYKIKQPQKTAFNKTKRKINLKFKTKTSLQKCCAVS